MDKERILWITRTGVFCALLIITQGVTAVFGNPYITGITVNLLLITSVLINGLHSGIAVALISPALAKLFGIGPLWSIIPCIMLGNLTIVSCWYLIKEKTSLSPIVSDTAAVLTGALLKFGVLYISIVVVAIPVFLNLPEQQAAVISAMFSVQQFVTATIGGVLAVVVVPLVRSGIKQGN